MIELGIVIAIIVAILLSIWYITISIATYHILNVEKEQHFRNRTHIGLSLSLCLRDILDGKIDINDVICIVSSTKFDNLNQAILYFQYLEERYGKDKVKTTLKKLWPVIYQPRKVNEYGGHTLNRNIHWITFNDDSKRVSSLQSQGD